jgi:hypothetical protein
LSKGLKYTLREAWGGEKKGTVVAKFRYVSDARLAMTNLNRYVWPSPDLDNPPFTVWYNGKRVKDE